MNSNECHDVLIIGSGPCGMAVANHLQQNNISSLILEAGAIPNYFRREDKVSMDIYRKSLSSSLHISEDIWSYENDSDDFNQIRCRNAGGRSLRWNGWLAEPAERNFIDRRSGKWLWPIEKEKIKRLLIEAKFFLGATCTELSLDFQKLEDDIKEVVLPKLAAIGNFSSRPFYALDRWLVNDSNIKIQTNTICIEVGEGKDKNYKIRCFQTDIGKEVFYATNIVVFAASPFETARLLFNSKIISRDLPVGKNYCDHIASSFLAVSPKHFAGEKIPYPTERGATIPELKIVKNSLDQAGFSAEIHGPNPPSVYEHEILKEAGLTEFSDVTCFSVNIIGELISKKTRNIVPGDTLDSLGRRKFKVELNWDHDEVKFSHMMELEGKRIAQSLAGDNGFAVKVRKTLTLGGTGTSHESGVCKMGFNPNESVVDTHGKIFGTSYAYIADASQMPTALDCHPTLTVVALAINTAESIVNVIKNNKQG